MAQAAHWKSLHGKGNHMANYGSAKKILDLALMLGESTTGITLDHIAGKLGVDKRTAQRMRDAVDEYFGGGTVDRIQLENGQISFRLRAPRLDTLALAAFKEEELAAFPTAVQALRRSDLNAQAEALDRAGARLRILLNQKRPKEAANLEDLLRYEGLARRPGPSRSYDETVVKSLREAMKSFHQVKITYALKDSLKSFQLIPLGFLYGERQHYLVASHADGFDGGRPHHFIISRIRTVETLEEIFEEDPDFSLADHAARSFGVYQEEPFEVEWLFSPEAAAEAENYIFHPSQQMSRNADGSLTVRFTAGGRLEMAWHLCTWGRQVKVVKPADFWAGVRKDLPEF